MGRFKWKELGLDYKLEDLDPASTYAIERACDPFRAVGLKTY